MTRTAPAVSLRAAGAAIPDLALALVFLTAWVAPATFQRGTITALLLLMLLEFIIIHSSAFMGQAMIGGAPRARRLRALLGFGAFYTLFAAGFALAFKVWWPLVSFWGLTLNRLLWVLVGQTPRGEERLFLQRTWAVTAMAYLGFVAVTVMLPVPRLGISDAVLATESLPGSGLWVDQPWRVLAFGFLYYAAVGVSELFDHRWLPASGLPRPAAQGAAAGEDEAPAFPHDARRRRAG